MIMQIPLTLPHPLSLSSITLVRSFSIFTELMNIGLCRSANTGVWESTGEHHLWVCPCFSSSAQHVLFILSRWFVRWEARGCIAAVLKGAAAKIYSKWQAESLCSYRLAFSPSALVKYRWCSHTIVLTQLHTASKYSHFIFSYGW